MSAGTPNRPPRIFEPDDPSLIAEPEPAPRDAPQADDDTSLADATVGPGAAAPSGFNWGAIFLSAVLGLAGLAFSIWLTRFVTDALARDDIIGWLATALVVIAGIAALAILLRETFALMRLRRLGRLRRDIEESLDARDVAGEKRHLHELTSAFSARDDLKWGIARYREHQVDVRDPGDLARLADREIFVPLDQRARRIVLASAKRVSVVTAIAPLPVVDVVFVLVENVRMLRALATLYGGRPGLMAALKLGRMVLTHLVATGGVALTAALLGQFLGHDLLRRLSRRLGEGAFNGTMTARIGTAAIHVIRPLPFLDATPVRVRDFLAELFRSDPAATTAVKSRS